jgi:alpha-maltose-1-phosphate synthase
MRILILSNGFEDYSTQLANALHRKGINVKIFFIKPLSKDLDQSGALDSDIENYRYPLPRLYNPSNLLLHYHLYKKIIDYKPDVIHSQGLTIWFSFILPIFKIKQIPVIITFHDPKPHKGENYLRKRIPDYLGRLFTEHVFVHGNNLKNLMIKEFDFPSSRIQVIPLGEHQIAPFFKFFDNQITEERNLILFFGRIYAYKGLEFLIKAEPLITKEIPDARIVIAGAGEDFEKYEGMMINKSHFLVYNYSIPYREGAKLFQKCCLVVLPYIDASQSGVVHTAYGFKKPVIVTDVGSLPEIVDDKITGMVVPPKDSQVLADAIIYLLKNDSLRRKMGMSGYIKLKTDLSWDSISNITIEIYKKIIDQRKGM